MIVALPVPLLPETIVIQVALGVAVHVHAAWVVSVMSFVWVPVALKVRLTGATTYVHPDAWLTAKVRPATVIFAFRAGPVLAATVKLIVLGPVPLAGMPVIHEGTPLLVQKHPAHVDTTNELAPPAAVAL